MAQTTTAESASSNRALKLAVFGGVALVAAAGLLWMRYGGEVFAAALQAAWTSF